MRAELGQRAPGWQKEVSGAQMLSVATGAGSRGSCGRQSVGVRVGGAGLPPTHVGNYRGGSD